MGFIRNIFWWRKQRKIILKRLKGIAMICPECGNMILIIHPVHNGWLECKTCFFPILRPVFIRAVKKGKDEKFKYKG